MDLEGLLLTSVAKNTSGVFHNHPLLLKPYLIPGASFNCQSCLVMDGFESLTRLNLRIPKSLFCYGLPEQQWKQFASYGVINLERGKTRVFSVMLEWTWMYQYELTVFNQDISFLILLPEMN